MTKRPPVPDATAKSAAHGEQPPADVAGFIRFCHRRRGATWPELYDEMCAVAARREYRGWDHGALAERGLTFSLLEMPRLANWCRAVLAGMAEERETDGHRGATTARPEARPVLA